MMDEGLIEEFLIEEPNKYKFTAVDIRNRQNSVIMQLVKRCNALEARLKKLKEAVLQGKVGTCPHQQKRE